MASLFEGHPELLSEATAIGKTFTYLLDFLGNQVPPWDRGILDAHLINAGTTPVVQEHLEAAERGRASLLARLSPWRRRYLDGLIWSLRTELERRSRCE